MKTSLFFSLFAALLIFSAFIILPEKPDVEGTFLETVEYNEDFQQHFIDELEDLDNVESINAYELSNGNINLLIEGTYNGKSQSLQVEISKAEYGPKRPRCSCNSNNKAYYWGGDRYVCILYCS